MKFNTQVCSTREQSERLLALGLKKETADMGWVKLFNGDGYVIAIAEDYSFIDIPAWSLHRLIAMLSKYCKREYYLSIKGNDIHYNLIGRTEYGISHYSFCEKENIYENLIDILEWLIKENHFNKQYLNESL